MFQKYFLTTKTLTSHLFRTTTFELKFEIHVLTERNLYNHTSDKTEFWYLKDSKFSCNVIGFLYMYQVQRISLFKAQALNNIELVNTKYKFIVKRNLVIH